ncbi:hypothetical protein ACTFIY_009772 [Dictyostelium cf. discoideum]
MKPIKRTRAHLVERTERRFNALSQALEIGNLSKASRDNGLTRDTLRYYYRDIKKNKVRGKHGGTRKKLMFTKEEYTLLVATIVEMVKGQPSLGLNEIANSISSVENSIFFGKVNKARVKSIFDHLGWNYHSPIYKQLNRYSDENLLKLFYFNTLIYNTDWSKLYFLDECSFSSRELTRKKAVGPIGKPIFVRNESSISETYNGFFMINLHGCKYKLRDENNTTEDFVQYLREVLESGFILSGSILVMDNAPIHGGVDALQLIKELLAQYSVELVFLPTYCPERNPIERFFGYIKNHFYQRRTFKKDFLDEIIDSINSARDHPDLFIKFYRQSLAFWDEKENQKYIRSR